MPSHTTTIPPARAIGVSPISSGQALGPDFRATAILLAALVGLPLFNTGETPSELARFASLAIGAALGAGLLLEIQKGLKNLFRVDIICLVGLYGLTLVEFLFPQPNFNYSLSPEETRKGLFLVTLGFGSFALGRHLLKPKAKVQMLRLPSLSPGMLLFIALGAFFIGNLYMFASVNFDPFRLFEELTGPRFGRPWGRGRYGDWKALLSELGLLNYIIPPIAGLALARRKEFSRTALGILFLVYLFLLFIAFTSGTRYNLAVHLGTFAIAHIFTLQRLRFWYVTALSVTILGIFLFGAYHMLEFRRVGLVQYLKSGTYASEQTRDTLFIDYNLHSLSLLADRFPGEYHYLGWEVPLWALIKPIPRALWSGKPKGLSIDIEQALGDEQRTVAATFIGEAYMGAGHAGIVIAGLLFGIMASWWNRLATGAQSTLGLLTYATGFFGGIICMRSLFWLTTAILPTLALIVFGKWIYPHFFQSKRF